jgi:hypothetical protein
LILYVDINFPNNLRKFGKYLEVAEGDLEEVSKFIPDAGDYILGSSRLNKRRIIMPDCLIKGGVDTPFFLIAYGKTFTIWAGMGVIVLPGLYLLNKICSQIKFFQEFIQSFFYNMPLRGFVELYLELAFLSFLNFKFIFFDSFTEIMASLMAVMAGTACMIFPFFCMSVLWDWRDRLDDKEFLDKWGMLTEDTNDQYLMQINYYPVFLF